MQSVREYLIAILLFNVSSFPLVVPACRLEKIASNLAAQEKKRADYKKTLPAKPLRQGLLQWIKKTACE